MTVSFVPEGFHTITPNIIVADAAAAIAFLCAALGAREVARLTLPDGKIVHAELELGDSRVNVGESMEGWPPHGLVAQVFVPNADESFARAVAAGATVIMPMTDMFFGTREGRVADAFGNTWTISTRIEALSYPEMQRRLNALAAG
jgi:PhnB protein